MFGGAETTLVKNTEVTNNNYGGLSSVFQDIGRPPPPPTDGGGDGRHQDYQFAAGVGHMPLLPPPMPPFNPNDGNYAQAYNNSGDKMTFGKCLTFDIGLCCVTLFIV